MKKIAFLIECENFIEILELLINKKYVLNSNKKEYYIWQYAKIKKQKQNGIIPFSFLLLDFYYIKKLFDEQKIPIEKTSNNKVNDFFGYSQQFFTAKNCKIINDAFNNIDIHTCGAKKERGMPRDYIDLLTELGLKDASHIV